MAASKTSRINMTEGLFFDAPEKKSQSKPIESVKPSKSEEPIENDVVAPVVNKPAEKKPIDDEYVIEPRKGVGRPKDPGEYQKVCVRLTKENYTKARMKSGIYGGVTAYLNYLIEKDQ